MLGNKLSKKKKELVCCRSAMSEQIKAFYILIYRSFESVVVRLHRKSDHQTIVNYSKNSLYTVSQFICVRLVCLFCIALEKLDVNCKIQ